MTRSDDFFVLLLLLFLTTLLADCGGDLIFEAAMIDDSPNFFLQIQDGLWIWDTEVYPKDSGTFTNNKNKMSCDFLKFGNDGHTERYVARLVR